MFVALNELLSKKSDFLFETYSFLLAAKRNIPHMRDCFIRKFLPFLPDGRTADN